MVAALILFVEILKELPATLMLRPANWDTLAVRVGLAVTEADAAAGVEWQACARLGSSVELRVVHVRGVSGDLLVLATNLDVDKLPAADVAKLYKQRWLVEYFFR